MGRCLMDELNLRDYSMFVDFNAKSTLRSSTITPYIYQEQRTECSDHNSQVCMYVSVGLITKMRKKI